VQVNAKMKAELRHIVLLLDNAPHILTPPRVLMGFDVYRLSNITLIFLPANTTSIVQPLDQGIIAAFKAHYRAQLVQFVISGSTETRHDDAAGQDQRHQAVKWVRHASKALTTATIRNCWWKAGILGRTKYQRHRPAERRRNARAGLQLPAMQGTLKRQHLMMW
jgi:hypothetical protein